MLTHCLVSRSLRGKHRNAALVPGVAIEAFHILGGLVRPSDGANCNPSDSGLHIPRSNRVADYDYDYDYDNDYDNDYDYDKR